MLHVPASKHEATVPGQEEEERIYMLGKPTRLYRRVRVALP